MSVVTNDNRELRAAFTDESVTVYQAYSPVIAEAACTAGTLVPPFRLDRTTWIKPSFFWMMYRSDWGRRPGQERILGIEVRRVAFDWLLGRTCLSSFDPALYPSRDTWQRQFVEADAIVQWDPDRSANLERLPRRTIQIGIRPSIAQLYVQDWIMGIEDRTTLAHEVLAAVGRGDLLAAEALAPKELPYPLPQALAARLGLRIYREI